MDYEKHIVDGKVAVLYSPGYGAGWYSWNPEHPGLLFDRDIVLRVLAKDLEGASQVAEQKYPNTYLGGYDGLTVMWLEPGTAFRINEYDGHEEIQVLEHLTLVA